MDRQTPCLFGIVLSHTQAQSQSLYGKKNWAMEHIESVKYDLAFHDQKPLNGGLIMVVAVYCFLLLQAIRKNRALK